MTLPDNILTPVGNLRGSLSGGGIVYPEIINTVSGPMIKLDDANQSLIRDYTIDIPYDAGGYTNLNIFQYSKNIAKITADNEVRVNGNPNRSYSNGGCTINVNVVGSYYIIWHIMNITPNLVGQKLSISYTDAAPNSTRFVYADNWSSTPVDITSTSFTINNSHVGKKLGVRFLNTSGAPMSAFNIQVEAGDATSYEPFKEPLTNNIDWSDDPGSITDGSVAIHNGAITLTAGGIDYDLGTTYIIPYDHVTFWNDVGDNEITYNVNVNYFLQWLYDNLYTP